MKPAPMKHRFVLGCGIGLLALATASLAQTTAPDHAQDQPPGALIPPTSASDFTSVRLDAVLAGDWRSPKNRARDGYRHPKATLQFFHLRPDQRVLEIAPGGGWYSEILAPLLRDNGHYVAAVPGGSDEESVHAAEALRQKFAADPKHYDKATVLGFDPHAPAFGKPGSADLVLTFRNVHNWIEDDTVAAMFKAFFVALRPGGVLGVVDHRAAPGADLAVVKQNGYLPVAYVVKLASDAGFVLDASSEINANPKDSKDYPKGVWTLPPSLALREQDQAKYLAIGESDRMTLRFVKPATPPRAAAAH